MADYMEHASEYFQNFATTRDTYMGTSNRLHSSADEFARMTLNALFLLNGGGLGVLATLRAATGCPVSAEALKYAAFSFVFGLIATLFSSAIAIMNFRALATKSDGLMNMALCHINEMKTAAQGDESTKWKNQAAKAEAYGRNIIWGTATTAWMFGVMSLLAFAIGALKMCAVT